MKVAISVTTIKLCFFFILFAGQPRGGDAMSLALEVYRDTISYRPARNAPARPRFATPLLEVITMRR